MIKVEMDGFDELTDRLDGLANRAGELNGKEVSVPLSELLNDNFVAEHSSFASFDELLTASPFKVETTEDFEAIPDAAWEAYIVATTSFESWQEMQKTAAGEHIGKMLGL